MMTMALSCVPLTKPAASVFRLWTNYSLRCSCCPQDRNHWPWQRKSEFLSHLELDFNPDQGCTVSSSYVPNYWCSTWAWMKEEGIIYRIVSLLVLGDLGGLQLDWLCVQKQRDIYYTIKRMAPWLITWRCTAWCFYIGLAITLHCYPSCMNTPAKMQPLGKSRDFVAALDADKTNSFNMIQVQGQFWADRGHCTSTWTVNRGKDAKTWSHFRLLLPMPSSTGTGAAKMKSDKKDMMKTVFLYDVHVSVNVHKIDHKDAC